MEADDRRLIAECRRGRTAAFGELVRRYQDRLYNAVLRFIDSSEDAADVVQEAFLNAYQSLDGFKGDALFYTWLYRIAMNAAISHKRRRRVVLSLEPVRQGDPGVEPSDESAFARPGEAMERAEDEAGLLRAIERLSPEHRMVLVLKDIEGQKYETIADVLGVPVGTIRSRLHRARLELRDLLQQEDGGTHG